MFTFSGLERNVCICRDDRIGNWIGVCERPNILLLTGSTLEEIESGVEEALKAALDSLPDEELWAEESLVIGAEKVIVDLDFYPPIKA